MKKLVLTLLLVVLLLGTAILMLGYREEIMAGEPLPFLGAGKAAPALAQAPAPTSAPTPVPTPTPVAEDPAECARLAWEALFTYPAHEAPIRVLALFNAPGGTGEDVYSQMCRAGKLMPKGVYYAQEPAPATGSNAAAAPRDPKEWAAQALAEVPVGLLDSIYAETPALALAAYEALREAGRNDSVEVICAGITPAVLAAMEEDHFSMGAAAGVYENELRVVYADDLR